MFLEQFSKYFTEEEKQTEMYALFSSIGVNMEKAIQEELTSKLYELTDINNFNEDTYRSWLAFFLMKIPYRISSECVINVEKKDDESKNIIIRSGDRLVSTISNKIWTVINNTLFTHKGEYHPIKCVQGEYITEKGVYNSFIKVSATNPDLRYIKLYINGVEIPEVSYTTSYDNLSFIGSWDANNNIPYLTDNKGTKGQYYIVNNKGTQIFSQKYTFDVGDVIVYDGSRWVKGFNNNSINPLQFSGTYVIPSNGFYAYYFNNELYIKVFAGTTVDNPNGKNFELSYIRSDGVQGTLLPNEKLKFINEYKDVDENIATFNVNYNGECTNGINQPSVGKLGLYLKQRLYTSINISSIPEYLMWFKAQDEIGDCKITSDFERWLEIKEIGGIYEPTGIVSIMAIDNNGEQLTDATKEKLLDRLEPYKDIAVLNFVENIKVKNLIKVQFTEVIEDLIEDYILFVKNTVNEFYNIESLQSKNLSLFDDLDLSLVLDMIMNNEYFKASGLSIDGYHCIDKEVIEVLGNCTGKTDTIDIPTYAQEGYDGFIELIRNGETITVYETSNTNSVFGLFDLDNITVAIHSKDGIKLYLDKCNCDEIKIYLSMANKGILGVGLTNGYRVLDKTVVERYDGR